MPKHIQKCWVVFELATKSYICCVDPQEKCIFIRNVKKDQAKSRYTESLNIIKNLEKPTKKLKITKENQEETGKKKNQKKQEKREEKERNMNKRQEI